MIRLFIDLMNSHAHLHTDTHSRGRVVPSSIQNRMFVALCPTGSAHGVCVCVRAEGWGSWVMESITFSELIIPPHLTLERKVFPRETICKHVVVSAPVISAFEIEMCHR